MRGRTLFVRAAAIVTVAVLAVMIVKVIVNRDADEMADTSPTDQTPTRSDDVAEPISTANTRKLPDDITKLEFPQPALSEEDEREAQDTIRRAGSLIERTDALVSQATLSNNELESQTIKDEHQEKIDALQQRLDELKSN